MEKFKGQHQHRHSISCFSACFFPAGAGERVQPPVSHGSDLPGLLERRCQRQRQRRRPYSADFRYDPLSYALNFDEGGAADDLPSPTGSLPPHLTFSSRFQASSPRMPPKSPGVEETKKLLH
ncbi:hypothetical protein IHE45_13G022300 [Dioscorea alata]|uniref:Uncharacterized protein n=1 Tax=Dioscorea alata TaxID=55571 RepID=A0ACB7UWQ2_DIOAL|nr:hypothetical protein IHE45_13G022300 [Dioscorea alata]